MTTWLFVDKDGVEWRVTSYGMTRTFRKRTLWIRFVAWLRRMGLRWVRGNYGH